jgi:hypothetical protein
MHNGSLMCYDYENRDSPVVRIVDCWPKLGEQHFSVRLYPDGSSRQETAYERREDLAGAVQLAEEWLT